MENMTSDLMSIGEICRKTGFGRSTIMKWMSKGVVQGKRSGERPNDPVLLSFAEVSAYIRENGIQPRVPVAKPIIRGGRQRKSATLEDARASYLNLLKKTAETLHIEIDGLRMKEEELRKIEEEISRLEKL